MRNTPGPSDSFESSHLPNFHEIQEVEQGKAKAAWEHLEKNVRQIYECLVHPQLIFFCTKDFRKDELSVPHYEIDVFDPSKDPNVHRPKADALFIQKEDGSFSLQQHVNVHLPLSPLEANQLLELIVKSERKN